MRDFVASGRPVAAICHAPWTLIEADVLKGRRLTSWPSLQTDIRNAGGEWVDEALVIDGNLITSRNPDDLPTFCGAVVESLEHGAAGRRPPSAAPPDGRRAVCWASAEPVAGERVEQLALLVGEVRQERVGEQVEGALELVERLLPGAAVGVGADEPDEGVVDLLEHVGDDVVLLLEPVDDGREVGLARGAGGRRCCGPRACGGR